MIANQPSVQTQQKPTWFIFVFAFEESHPRGACEDGEFVLVFFVAFNDDDLILRWTGAAAIPSTRRDSETKDFVPCLCQSGHGHARSPPRGNGLSGIDFVSYEKIGLSFCSSNSVPSPKSVPSRRNWSI